MPGQSLQRVQSPVFSGDDGMLKLHFFTPWRITLLCLLVSAGVQAETNSEHLLVEQGQYWQQRDTVRAAEAWHRLLQVQPDHVAALVGLTQLAIQAQQEAQARTYLQKIKALHPNYSGMGELEQAVLLLGAESAAVLEQAHALGRLEKAQEAVVQYQKLFNGHVPTGPLGREYYSVLGYTPTGWAEAVEGLERLRQQSPQDTQLLLALAKLQALRSPTRTQGIRTLALLSLDPQVGTEATQRWREALSWMGAPPPASAAALFEAYLQAHPDDAEIRRQYTTRAKTGGARMDAFGRHLKNGFSALEKPDLAAAEQALTAALRLRPRDASALGGLGVLRLRQKQYAQAQSLLAQAVEQGDATQWQEALGSARYWNLVEQARTAKTADLLDDATRLLEEALQMPERESSAALELAQLYQTLQSPQDSERILRQILTQAPDNEAALESLITLLASTQRTDEALQLLNGLEPTVQQRLGWSRLQAVRSVALGRAALAAGDGEAAASYWEDALTHTPDAPWLRLELARLLQSQNQPARALVVTEALLQEASPEPQALYVAALLRSEQQDWEGTQALLTRIPSAQRTTAMQALLARATLQTQLAHSRALAQRGAKIEVRALLERLSAQAGHDDNALADIASAYTDVGELVHARAVLRTLLARSSPSSPSLQLQYAGLLLQIGDTSADFVRTMNTLSQVSLDTQQQGIYHSLQRGYALRQADMHRQRGELALAYEALRPALLETPDDPQVLSAWARMYVDAGQMETALQLYTRALAAQPNDVPTLQAAAGAAAAQKHWRQAEHWLQQALAQAPQDTQLLLNLGQLYRQQGKNSKALPLLRQVQTQLMQQQVSQTVVSPTLTASALQPVPPTVLLSPDNPFADLPHQPVGPVR